MILSLSTLSKLLAKIPKGTLDRLSITKAPNHQSYLYMRLQRRLLTLIVELLQFALWHLFDCFMPLFQSIFVGFMSLFRLLVSVWCLTCSSELLGIFQVFLMFLGYTLCFRYFSKFAGF